MKKLLIIAGALSLGGCISPYSLVKPGPQKVRGTLFTKQAMTVTPSGHWNSAPAYDTLGDRTTWTMDGTILNSVTFFPGIRDGKVLFPTIPSRDGYPEFSADMLPNEIVELVETSIAKLLEAVISDRGELKPITIDGVPGFQYSFDFVAGEIPKRAFVAGAVKDGELFLLLYQATSLHYYDKYLQRAKDLAASMQLSY